MIELFDRYVKFDVGLSQRIFQLDDNLDGRRTFILADFILSRQGQLAGSQPVDTPDR